MVANIIEKLKTEFPQARLIEVNVAEHPEVAIKYRIMVTPAIAINGKLEFTGIPKEEALRKRIADHAKSL